jgi:hypothetical protein
MDVDSLLRSPKTPGDPSNAKERIAISEGGVGLKSPIGTLTDSFGSLGTGKKNTFSAHNLKYTAGNPSNSFFNSQGRSDTNTDPDDDVFAEKLSFPHAYKKVRALRISATKTARLGSMEAAQRVVTNTPAGLMGFDIPDDDRQFQVMNYHIPALKKNISISAKKLTDESTQLVCVSCKEKHFFTGQEPVLVILSDQHFPPALPSTGHQCAIVIRCEDALLHELPGLLKEFFVSQDGKVRLPEGSAILFGALSHLAARGLDNYADEVVKTYKTIGALVHGQITTAHNIMVPLGGVCSDGLIRMMIDLDCWLQGSDTNTPYALSRTRELLWQTLLDSVPRDCFGSTGEKIYFIPESPISNRKIRFVAQALTGGLPRSIGALSEDAELKIMCALMDEINDVMGFDLDTYPDLTRIHKSFVGIRPANRIIIIGASHTKRIAGSSAFKNHKVVDLSVPGWKPDTKNVEKLCAQLDQISLTASDTVVLDPLSNNAFCGTNSDGVPEPMFKDCSGKYHCPGSLSMITQHMSKKILAGLKQAVDKISDCKVVVMVPVMRYIVQKCCQDPTHIENFGTPSVKNDLINGVDSLVDLLHGWGEAELSNFTIMDIFDAIANREDLWGDGPYNGGPAWIPDDPVHLVPKLYDDVAERICAFSQAEEGDDVEPTSKRQRLESVVVKVRGAQSMGPPATAVQARPGWSSGEIVRPQSSGGRFFRGQINRGAYRGWQRRPYRGQKRSNPY